MASRKTLEPLDVTLEFIEAAIHNIIFMRQIYPVGIFSLKKKYGVPIHVSIHPELNAYINETLTTVRHLASVAEISQINICFFDSTRTLVERFVFGLNRILLSAEHFESLRDFSEPDLNQLRESFRAFLLKLSTAASYLKDLPKPCTFKIMIHTTESIAMELANNPMFEHFPWIEAEGGETQIFNSNTVPIKLINTDLCEIQIYAEESALKS